MRLRYFRPFLLSWLMAAIALGVAGRAQADLTAVYRAPHSDATLVVEVASNGDMRAGGKVGSGYSLWSRGVGYEVQAGPGGPVVMRAADIAFARTGKVPASIIEQPWVPVGKAEAGGFKGTRYKIKGAEQNPDASSLVISDDPSLSPLAAAFRHLEDIDSATFPGLDGPERRSFRDALAQGAPIVRYDWRLVSLDPAPISPNRFTLPRPPLARAEVVAARGDPVPDTAGAMSGGRASRVIRRAAFAAGVLWLVDETGRMATLAPGGSALREQPTPDNVREICVVDDQPAVLSGEAGRFRLLRRAGGAWRPSAGFALRPDERVLAMRCTGARTLVLTDKRLFVTGGDSSRAIPLAPPITQPAIFTTLLDDGAYLYAGLDAGEWGGGLARIDLSTGRVATPHHLVGGVCDGPLHPGCDPVNGVARAPGKPGCVIVAIGLIHFLPRGRLTLVCGDRVRRLYYKPYTTETSWPADPPREPFGTVPFFGLTESHGVAWAVATDGLYIIGRQGPVRFRKMPPFRTVDGVRVSFAIPGLVLVDTTINSHVSVSGAVPMLVAR